MPLFTFNPTGDWRNDGWALVGAGVSFLYQALSIVDDTKYIKCPASKAGAAVTFPYDTNSVPDGAVITSITIKLRAATGTGSAPAGTSPTVTVAVASADDPSKFVLRTIPINGTIQTYEVATYQRDALGLIWDVFRLNQLFCRVFTYLGVADLCRVYQLFCEVKYRVRPTITVDSPTGTVVTPSPTIAWTYTQADGDPQAKATYKIFPASQVSQIGFNPEKSNPVYQNTVLGDIQSVMLPTSINPNDYWVYVQSESTFKAKSVWVGRQFTVSGSSPGSPGVADPASPGEAVILVVPDREQGSASLTLRDNSNMLSAQDADAESPIDNDQFSTVNGTFVRDTSTTYPGGTSSWKLTATAGGTASAVTDWIEVDGDGTAEITARAQFKAATTGRNARVVLTFYDDAFTSVGGTLTGSNTADATGTWTDVSVTGTVPTTAVYAKASFDVLSAGASEVHNLDHLGVMYGHDTPWSDGGHMSRNLLSAWYSSPGGTAQVGESWIAGSGSTATTATNLGTGASGSTCNKVTWNGLSPQIGFRAASTVFTSPTSGANFTLNKPTGTASGDLMIAYVTATGYVTMATVPAGWTLVNTSTVNDGTLESLTMFVLKRTAGGAEPASWTDGTISAVAGCRQAVVVGYTGAADASLQFISETQVGSGNATPLTLTTSSISNTDPNAWRASAFAVSDNVSTGTLTANRQTPSAVPAITYVGLGTPWGSNTSGSYTINKPSGTQTGDLMIASLGTVSSATVTPPAGWTVRYQGSYTSNGGPSLLCVMYRIAGASEPASWTGTYSGGSSYGRNVTQCVAYRNVNAAAPFIDSAGNSLNGVNPITTGTVTNTNSLAWRISIFAGLTTGASGWTSSEAIERNDNYYTYSSGTESVAMFDSNGSVGTGSYTRTGTSSASTYAVNSFIGLLNPLSAPPATLPDETARISTSSIGSANPYLHLRAFDSAGVVPSGGQSLTGTWAPTTGTDKNSMVGWQGLIKPAAPVTAGYASATMAAPVDLSKADWAKISESGQLTATAAFIGSAAGTPYLTVNFYRANVLLQSLIQQGNSFGTGTWVKSAATFDIPDGTTRVSLGISVSDREIGDIVYWDRCSLAFGTDSTYRKSTSRSTHPIWSRPIIEYADDFGDGNGYSDYVELPGLLSNPPHYEAGSGLADYVDHTVIPLTNRHYRARTQSLGLLGDQFVSDWGPESSEFSFEATNWWLKDIANPDLNIALKVTWDNMNIATTNSATVYQPLGEDLPVVLTEGYKGDTFALSMRPVGRADWAKLRAMLMSGKTLFLQSDIDHAWWVRPVGDLSADIFASNMRQSKPFREVQVSFVQVAPEV
jgi:hypothetical protein